MHSLPRRSRGLSLLELLVALSIGIFLVGGVVSLFLASKRSYTETDRFSRVAESGRFALVTLGRDLRQAGFFGAAGLANLSTDPDTGAVVGDCTAPADAYGYGTYFRVVRASAAGVAVGCVTDAVPDSDVIIIKAVRAVPLTDGDRDNRADDDGIIDRPEAINNQRTYILANTDRGVLFRGNDGTPPTITAGGDVPQGEAWQYQAFVYYVRNTGNVPTLSRKTLGWNGANMATRTESRDDVFYAMFRPTTGVNWPGNIKKLKVRVAANGSAALVDSAGNEAIDSQTGFIKESAVTFWGSNPDGPAVSSGGVGARLAARDPDGRVIKTNTGTNGALQDFNITNINRDAYSLTTDAQLHSLFDAGSANELADLIAWARGWTDRNKTARRDWILGDIVHSRPLVLNYGARTSDFSASNPDLRVVVGTNAGFLHMFDTANGNENWAFFPKELTKIFKARKDDVLGGNKVWGVDAPVVSYRFDANQDGSIKAVDGDKMYIVFGLRRGGRALYAMDVTDPDNPSFLWRIGPDTAGFSELGQTWSVPVVTNVPGYVVGGVRRPVLVFGAGYDSVNDDITRTAAETVDTVGRGLFVVDVATGALVWSVTPAADSATNKREPGFVHAMAAPPSVIDSNGDGIADRVYMPDVGGNVWRIDMPGNTRPTAATEQNRWRVTKLASLANVALLNPARQAGDRRFLSEVDVVRTTYQGKAFDAVLLGSGDRTNPKATDNVDRFYMLRDYQVAPYVNDAPTFLQCTALVNPSTDNRCRLPITESNLFDATDNTIQVGNVSERATARNSLATSMGWFVTLGSSLGEKSLSAATTLRGTTFFTTFAPNSATASTTICEPAAGTARLYALNLQDGSATIDFNGNGALVTADRSALLGSTVPDSPSLYFARDQQIRLLFPAGGGPAAGTRGAGGSNCGPGILCGPRGLRPVVPTYRYEQEY